MFTFRGFIIVFMEFVLISVICSVVVSVILKFGRVRGFDTTQMIIWNYPVAILLTVYFFPPVWAGLFTVESPWLIYGVMSFLLPGLFLLLSKSLKYAGLVVTEVAQRISLIISLLAAFLIFNESISGMSLWGICLGFLSILCCINWQNRGGGSVRGTGWQSGQNVFPALVFLGYGLVDILFKKISQLTVVPYTTSMLIVFIGAGVVSFSYYFFQLKSKRMVFSSAFMGWGLLLGVFNFMNILFYMKAHRALPEQPSLIFTGMNIGVIALGVLIGKLVFKEKITVLKLCGVVLAVVAVLILANNL